MHKIITLIKQINSWLKVLIPYETLKWQVMELKVNVEHISHGIEEDIPEYQPEVTRKPWRVMSHDAEGRGWHNAPELSCHRGADILV